MNRLSVSPTAGILWLLSGLLPALPACTPLEPLPPARAMPTPVLATVEYHHMVRFSADQAEIGPAEAAALQAFLATIPNGPLHTARLTSHTEDRAGNFYNADLSTRRIARIAEMIRTFSVYGSELTIIPFAESTPAGALPNARAWTINDGVDVFISGTEVVLPGCPNWSTDPGFDPGNLPLSNLGCANAYNLGMMIANPRDLTNRRPLAPGDGTHEADAITRYRTDKVKALHADVIQ